ncbi:MAG TPA: sugar phosphate isomerase/epimerase family protein [Bryobacteraceae bacterium]|nr:sugar phosphate isomerase/epimerase family protein [Bryobacteraceae bacterium]
MNSTEMKSSAPSPGRRRFLQTVAGASAAVAMANRASAAESKPRLGIVTNATGPGGPEKGIAKVHALGFRTCQVHVGMSPDSIVEPLRQALAKYQIEATAVMTLGEGKMVWDFYEGPLTIGIIPPSTRAARINALKRASDLAKKLNIEAVHTHCGFIPENPNLPLYQDAVKAIHEIASYCKANGQSFMMETGQETPVTLLRAIHDVGLDNVRVNLDTANLILYDMGEPVGALDVIGKYVHGLHAKDGLYPTDPKNLGKEVPIGKGRVNFPALMEGLKKLNYTGPITIEREISGPKQEADIRASKAFLEKLIDRVYGA